MKEITGKMLDKKYFIFDIDGTLVDSMPMWSLIDQKVLFDNFGIVVAAEDIKAFRDSILYDDRHVSGDIYSIYYEEFVKLFNLGITGKEFKKLRYELATYLSVNELDFKEGAADFLNALKLLGKKIAVASTTTKKQYSIYENLNQNMIKKAPLKKLVDSVVLCEDVVRKKPDPEAYVLAMQKLGAKPEECIVFEDSLNGVMAAKTAGIEVCSVYDASAHNEQDIIEKIADYKVESFAELVKILGLTMDQGGMGQ